MITEVAGIKFTLPAGEEIFLWENGNIKQCYSSNPTTAKVKGAEYQLKEVDRCLFHRDGTLRAIAAGNDYFIDTFYSEGAPKRIIRYKDIYDAKKDEGYVAAFISQKNYRLDIGHDYLNLNYIYGLFYLQKGGLGRNISMVFFDDNDNPSSYTMLKTDKDGNYILDDEGVPIEDSKKKKFIKG